MKRQARKVSQRWSESTQLLRERITNQYSFDSIGNEVLANMLDAHERMIQSALILDREGLVIEDRFKQKKMHPAFEAEAVSRAAVLKHAHSLGLDMATITEGEQR